MYGPDKSSYFKCSVRSKCVTELKSTGVFSGDEAQSN